MNNQKDLKDYTKQELAVAILKLVGAGLLLSAVFVAPNLAQLYKYFRAHKSHEQRKLYFKLRALTKGGYIARQDGAYLLTQKGRKELAENEVWELRPEAKKRAAFGWCLIMYDLPKSKEKARQALRARLEELGCKRYQDSVYYHRDDLHSVLAPFAEFYGIRLHVRFLYVKNLEGIDS